MNYQPLELTTERFEAFVKTHLKGDLLQLPAWGDVKQATGWTHQRIAVGTPDGQPIGVALLLFKQVPKLPFTLCYAPRGFVVDYANKEAVTALRDLAIKVAKQHKAIAIKLDPNIDRDEDPTLLTEMMALGFKHNGFGGGFDHAQPRFTMETSLEGTEKEIFDRFHSKFRYNVRLAERKGIVCYEASREELKTFAKLMVETGERDGFSIRGLDYFENLYDHLRPNGDAALFLTKLDAAKALESTEALLLQADRELAKIHRQLEKETTEKKIKSLNNRLEQTTAQIDKAEKSKTELMAIAAKHPDGVILSGGLLTLAGRRSYYLYGASSNEYREFMPNHLMQWTMMQYAKAHGAVSYDFGGVSGSTDPDDHYAGLYAFKSGWGSTMIEKIGEFDYVLNKPLYLVLETGLPILKRLRKKFRR
ncbi:lipid II:glycine glycyltransferase FemX [Exiguobacterium oxidotolerans]|uniref:Lipid II:glycine glycyltransferase n=1 Tax=Exiguobacterium oxidotolerans TaxID=223958 RepID=A0A653ICR2_9BACL|nr:lipid II:glycine glycyltransferase FemX [Exiguobacterium oxidotolerans]VWX36932.1 Lipid II:glycine glycyltransferase [Exiguobacterium oxidotolerans]